MLGNVWEFVCRKVRIQCPVHTEVFRSTCDGQSKLLGGGGGGKQSILAKSEVQVVHEVLIDKDGLSPPPWHWLIQGGYQGFTFHLFFHLFFAVIGENWPK